MAAPRTKSRTRLALLIAVAALAAIALLITPAGIDFHAGLLPTANDPFLDGSNNTIQKISWHLGNGRRTWGETHGLKFHRAYVTISVKHTNPNISVSQAAEDQ